MFKTFDFIDLSNIDIKKIDYNEKKNIDIKIILKKKRVKNKSK